MEYPYFKGLEADRYSFYRVPKALVKADLFQKMSGDAKLLYAVLLDRMSLSIKNGWQDMLRTKGSKNRPKTNITKDYASQIAEKQEIIASLNTEIASIHR